tara:strand:+ start:181 stop:1095 length:915 start_codon:yes stop_codon:yes gene_type:complete
MKKIFIISIFLCFFYNVGYSEVINLDCKYPSGAKFGGSFDVDLIKKKVNQYPFEKGSTNKIIKAASFTNVEGSIWNAFFFTVNLNTDTIELIRVDNIDLLSPKSMAAVKNDDTFSLIPSNPIKINLNCERISKSVDFSKNNLNEKDTFQCQDPETKYKSNLNVVRKINKEYIVLKETMDLNMGFELKTIYFAKSFGDHIAFFHINEFEDTKELTYANLYPKDKGKRELRYLIFKLNDNQYNKLIKIKSKFGKFENEIKNYDLSSSKLNNEIDLYNMQVDLYYKLTPSQEKAAENLIGGSRYFCE